MKVTDFHAIEDTEYQSNRFTTATTISITTIIILFLDPPAYWTWPFNFYLLKVNKKECLEYNYYPHKINDVDNTFFCCSSWQNHRARLKVKVNENII